METFKLPRAGGTYYEITGTALTEVHRRDPVGAIRHDMVIQLASGEKVLYIYSRPAYPMANKHAGVMLVYRNAQNMTAEEIASARGSDSNNAEIFNALGTVTLEVIA